MTNRPLKIWFPNFETEAHRQGWQGAQLVARLAEEGVYCTLQMGADCNAVFVASFSISHDAAHGYTKHPYNRPIAGYRQFSGIPVIHFCWDLYPWKIEGDNDPTRWRSYLTELRSKQTVAIFVPSHCTVERVREYTKKEAKVVLSSTTFWDSPVSDGRYVVDVMRPYPGDPNNDLCQRVCNDLGIPCCKLDHELSQEEFHKLVAGASVLISAVQEASTGGLTLLEGYALGKPVLLAHSDRHGGVDYFGDRAHYFQWDQPGNFRDVLLTLWNASESTPIPGELVAERRVWAEENYSTEAFARRLTTAIREVLG